MKNPQYRLLARFALSCLIASVALACVPPTPPEHPGAPAVLAAARATIDAEARRTANMEPRSETTTERTPEARLARPVAQPYTGDLSIFEGKDRERKLQINRVMDILGVAAGKSVADIGAGSGWFTVRAARRVGEGGQVYAVEINQEYLDYIEKRAEREQLSNIRTVAGREDDPALPQRSVDAVLILKTYHEIAEPVGVLRRVRDALKPNGRIGIIDRNITADNDHGVLRDEVVSEAARAGLRLVEEHDFVKPDGEDYFLVFEANQ